MIRTLTNFNDCSVLDMKDIKSINVKEIQVDMSGNMAYAIVCYPGPGAGYIMGRYNNLDKAKRAFKKLIHNWKSEEDLGHERIVSAFVAPEVKEPENIGEVQVAEEA